MNYLVRYILTVALLAFAIPVLYAQQGAGIEWLTTKDGLSQGFVGNILQDREGYIWISTKNGLNRYDGYHFQVFTHDPYDEHTFSEDFLSTIAEYRDFLIVGTQSSGLNLFCKKTHRVYRIPKEVLSPDLSDTNVSVMWSEVDAEGNIWLEVEAPNVFIRLFKIVVPPGFWENPEQGDWMKQFKSIMWPQPLLGYGCMSEDGKSLFVPSPNEVFQVNAQSGNWTKLDVPLMSGQKSLKTDLMGNLWIAHEYTPGACRLYRLQPDRPSSLKEPAVPPGFQQIPGLSKDHIWLYSFGLCWLFQLDKNGDFDINHPVIDPIKVQPGRYCAITDRSGLMWLGTNGLGVIKINLRSGQFHHVFKDQSIYGKVSQDRQGNIFAYSNTPSPLYTSDLAGPGHPPPYWSGMRELTPAPSSQVMQDAGGNYWLAGLPNKTRTFVLKKMDTSGRWSTYSPPTDLFNTDYLVFQLDEKEQPWIVLQGQLLHFDPIKEQFEHFDYFRVIPDAVGPTALAKTRDGSWWIGTGKGLVRAQPSARGFDFVAFKNDAGSRNSLHNNSVASLLPDPGDPFVLWIGSKGGGLDRLDTRTLQFTHLTTREGLPNDVIYGILPDEDGNLWMSSNKGLIRYTPATGAIKNYTKEDGVQDNEFNTWAYYKSPTGQMLFGGVKGLTVFRPRDLEADTVPPRTLINGLRVNDRDISWNDESGVLKEGIDFTSEIVLPYAQNSLTLEFVALNFVSPGKNRFRYYLEGAEEEWKHESAEHAATYLNLAPGTYVFRVKGSNSEGVWSDQPAELKITILPPWYRSWPAWMAYVLLLGGGAYGFYRYQLGRKLEHAENLRLKDMDAFKSRFFTNVTHEFRTPLTVILGMADRLDGLASGSGSGSKMSASATATATAISLIRRNGQNLLRLINEILDLAKLESNTLKMNYVQGDVLAYLRYISESLHSLANVKNVMLRLESEQARIEMDYDPERLLQIIYNLLSNAVKFTPGGGKVLLRADLVDQWLHIQVADTGVGIPSEDLPFVFERFYQAKNQEHNKAGGTGVGLSLTRELVRAMGGGISAESEAGKGTAFKIRLPVTRQAEPVKPETAWNMPMQQPVVPLVRVNTIPSGAETPQLLIIEDNPDVVEYLSGCLQGQYQLDFAYNGRAGIEKALDSVPDIIISDVMMPEKDGFEVCDTLKNDERTSHIPIVLLTARASMEDRIAGLRRGADAYLAKPFHPEELLVTLANLTQLRARLQARYATGQAPVPTEDKGLQIEDAFLQKVRSIIEANLSDPDFEMPQLERKMAMSRSQIFRKMKALTGRSPSQFIRGVRLEKAKELLAASDMTVSEIAYETGFSSLQYFSDVFYEAFGLRPSATRN